MFECSGRFPLARLPGLDDGLSDTSGVRDLRPWSRLATRDEPSVPSPGEAQHLRISSETLRSPFPVTSERGLDLQRSLLTVLRGSLPRANAEDSLWACRNDVP